MAHESQEQIAVRAEQIKLVYHSAIRTVPGVAVAVAGIAYLVVQEIPNLLPYAWALTIFAIYAYRMIVARNALRTLRDAQEFIAHSSIMTGLTTVMGVLAGAGLLYFISQLSGEKQALVIMICIGWIAGAVGVSSQYPRYIIPWYATFGVSLALAWLLFGSSNRLLISMMLVLLLAYLWITIREVGKKTADSIRIRFENIGLVAALEQRKSQVEAASEAKSRFMAAASHDLRQPLTSINLMHARLLRATDAEDAVRLARKLSGPVRALESILDSLVEIARLDGGGVTPDNKPFDLKTLASEIEEEFQPRAETSGLTFDIEADQCIVVADRHLTLRALSNLVDNAFKFTERGTVSVSMRCPDSHTLDISVRDSGVGIAAHDLPHIFEDYFRSSSKTSTLRAHGLGLGLAIVARLVKLQGGTVTPESNEGRGSVFHVRIPAPNIPGQVATVVEAPKPVESTPGLQILCVEDHADIQDGMYEWGDTYGHRMLFASTGEDALEMADALQPPPDVLVVDYRLPGIDGLAVIDHLRQRWTGVPAILLTGEADLSLVDQAKAAGVLMLRKPVAPDRLESEIMAMRMT